MDVWENCSDTFQMFVAVRGLFILVNWLRTNFRCFSAQIDFHNPENRPLTDGICVANHTSPIDVLILSTDRPYSMVEYCSPYYLLIHIFHPRLVRPTVVSWVCASVVSLLGPLISGSSAQKSMTGPLFLRGISVKQISALSSPFQDWENMWKTLTSFQSWSSLRAPASTTPVSCSSRRAPWRLVELSIRQQLSMMPDLGMHSGTGNYTHSTYRCYYFHVFIKFNSYL